MSLVYASQLGKLQTVAHSASVDLVCLCTELLSSWQRREKAVAEVRAIAERLAASVRETEAAVRDYEDAPSDGINRELAGSEEPL